jgi:hypothetical protein
MKIIKCLTLTILLVSILSCSAVQMPPSAPAPPVEMTIGAEIVCQSRQGVESIRYKPEYRSFLLIGYKVKYRCYSGRVGTYVYLLNDFNSDGQIV